MTGLLIPILYLLAYILLYFLVGIVIISITLRLMKTTEDEMTDGIIFLMVLVWPVSTILECIAAVFILIIKIIKYLGIEKKQKVVK